MVLEIIFLSCPLKGETVKKNIYVNKLKKLGILFYGFVVVLLTTYCGQSSRTGDSKNLSIPLLSNRSASVSSGKSYSPIYIYLKVIGNYADGTSKVLYPTSGDYGTIDLTSYYADGALPALQVSIDNTITDIAITGGYFALELTNSQTPSDWCSANASAGDSIQKISDSGNNLYFADINYQKTIIDETKTVNITPEIFQVYQDKINYNSELPNSKFYLYDSVVKSNFTNPCSGNPFEVNTDALGKFNASLPFLAPLTTKNYPVWSLVSSSSTNKTIDFSTALKNSNYQTPIMIMNNFNTSLANIVELYGTTSGCYFSSSFPNWGWSATQTGNYSLSYNGSSYPRMLITARDLNNSACQIDLIGLKDANGNVYGISGGSNAELNFNVSSPQSQIEFTNGSSSIFVQGNVLSTSTFPANFVLSYASSASSLNGVPNFVNSISFSTSSGTYVPLTSVTYNTGSTTPSGFSIDSNGFLAYPGSMTGFYSFQFSSIGNYDKVFLLPEDFKANLSNYYSTQADAIICHEKRFNSSSYSSFLNNLALSEPNYSTIQNFYALNIGQSPQNLVNSDCPSTINTVTSSPFATITSLKNTPQNYNDFNANPVTIYNNTLTTLNFPLAILISKYRGGTNYGSCTPGSVESNNYNSVKNICYTTQIDTSGPYSPNGYNNWNGLVEYYETATNIPLNGLNYYAIFSHEDSNYPVLSVPVNNQLASTNNNAAAPTFAILHLHIPYQK